MQIERREITDIQIVCVVFVQKKDFKNWLKVVDLLQIFQENMEWHFKFS